jgi:mannose-6-phosphate isomerase-like protein (cupin superfamily)
MKEFFTSIKKNLESQGFTVDYQDLNRPWGGFYALEESQAQKFISQYFANIDLKTVDKTLDLKPKILMVAPDKRLSWQYHHRRSELWRVVEGPVGVVMSETNKEGELQTYQVGELITLPTGIRHRLVGLDNVGVIAEIWQHTDASNPSDEEDIIRLQDDFGREKQ